MDVREAYVVLNCLPEIGPVRVKALLQHFGSPVAILAAGKSALLRVHGIGEAAAEAVSRWRDHGDPQAEMALAARAGVELVTLEDAAYPPILREIYDPPLCLYVRGDKAILSASSTAIAMVGSRRTTHYGVKMAETLAGAAALAGWTVVSGLARGIDTVVHETAVKLNGRTVAVIGSGLGRIYPQENIELARRVADCGALVSEFPMTFPPGKGTFPMRNRIIAGLTVGTVVIQAGDRSGSLITAAQALDQNRALFAVPGPVDAPQSRGCHALIKEGAKLVETFQDVLDEFTLLPGLADAASPPGRPRPLPAAAAASHLQLSESEAKLMALIDNQEIALDELVDQTGLAPAEVLGTVFMLELKHLVRQLPGRRVVKA